MMGLQGQSLALPAGSTPQAPAGCVGHAAALPRERLACVPAPVSAQPAGASPTAMPAADWGALLNAVTQRLQRLTDAAPGQLASQHTQLRECVDALKQLNAMVDVRVLDAAASGAELAATQAELAVSRTELARAQLGRRRAQHQAMHDALTQLPNRRHFHRRVASSLARADGSCASLAVLYVDLDGFKSINDEHGHDTGDATLCIVAQRLARALRAEDTVCRLGGDEFACLLVAPAGREQLSKVVCKLFDAVAAPLKIGALRLSVQPSIGIAMYPADGTTGAALLRCADAAMFQAKRRQLGYAYFEGCSDL